MHQIKLNKSPVQKLQITPEHSGRRIDNYLLSFLGNIPKTRIYKMLRKGEVRVNGGRVKPDYRLQQGDLVRIPPVYTENEENLSGFSPSGWLMASLQNAVIYEDEFLLVLNKPAGIAVHSGSREKYGVIEILRHMRPGKSIELVHRLDKPTSGCLLLAKDHRILRNLNGQLSQSRAVKYYLALLKGHLTRPVTVNMALTSNVRASGERKVKPDIDGKSAESVFTPLQHNNKSTYCRIRITTGRTHQIRVHAATSGHPVAGDEKYGDRQFNAEMKRAGLKRMFLHAEQLQIKHPETGKSQKFQAGISEDLHELLDNVMNTKKNR